MTYSHSTRPTALVVEHPRRRLAIVTCARGGSVVRAALDHAGVAYKVGTR